MFSVLNEVFKFSKYKPSITKKIRNTKCVGINTYTVLFIRIVKWPYTELTIKMFMYAFRILPRRLIYVGSAHQISNYIYAVCAKMSVSIVLFFRDVSTPCRRPFT